MRTSVLTLSLDDTCEAITRYNSGHYGRGGDANVVIDQKAENLIVRPGLARTRDEIEIQIDFVGRRYGGTAFTKSLYIVPRYASEKVHQHRDRVLSVLSKMNNWTEINPMDLRFLMSLFIHEVNGKKYWAVWAAKFFHMLRPDVLPILDSYAERALGVPSSQEPVERYRRFGDAFLQLVESRREWLEPMRQADQVGSWSVLKLWDKVLYVVGGKE